MASTPNIITDISSVTLAGIRRAIQNRTQGQGFFGRVIPTPTHQQLRETELTLLKGLGSVAPDWRVGGPSSPEVFSPTQRIDRNLYIVDLVDPSNKIKIQFVPQELDYDPDSNWETVAAVGRNNGNYQYTGSEDVLKFQLDWYAESEDRKDVLLRCKQVESLTKNDGFDNPPHHVKLIWGDTMFSDATWVVIKAPYKMRLFQAHRSMLPQQAYQEVTLKRVTVDNTTISQIRNINH